MTHSQNAQTSFIRRSQVETRTGLARSTIYKLISEGKFPKPIKITDRAVAWLSDEIDKWIEVRVSERSM
jgi:prophage regulatory protein